MRKLITLICALTVFPIACKNNPLRKNDAFLKEKKMTSEKMHEIYNEIKTDFKYGIILKDTTEKMLDCPNVFRHGEKWYLVYIIFDGKGYETALAESADLLHWKPLGKILEYTEGTWDANQAAGGIALHDYQWGGSYQLEKFQGKYWLSYLGGALTGYETEPLSIGLAWTTQPDQPVAWQRVPENPILTSDDPTARDFERKTLYKSHIIWDEEQRLGDPFIMFYNAKQKGEWVERIGMAVSSDLIHWKRHLDGPVIDNRIGISGDPQITQIGDVWVMFYFGHKWRPDAFDTFACSYDLEHWTKWDGPNLIQPSEPWDQTFAHKPWVMQYNGVVYHFYCAVGDQGRTIALATSKDFGKSEFCQ